MTVSVTRRSFLTVLCAAALFLATSGCGVPDFRQPMDQKFGDQNFKSAIAIIELHKVRFGSYPASLRDLRFTGEWDKLWLNAVEYRKLDDGYELNLTRGWVGKPDLKYPADFWQGLGVRKTNVRREAN